MFAPRPPVSLEGHCSAIHNNILYTYSQKGFLSIPLEYNATWTELTPGVPVSDAVCVTGGIDGDETQQALYIVGGTSSKSENPGLQRYSFKDKKWKTIPLTGDNLSNRTSHGAVYLKSISSIFVYGGHPTDGSIVTSDTFIARTYEPYDLDSQSGENASPAASPVLLAWSDDEAALFGGETTPEGVHFWNSDRSWYASGFEMQRTLPVNAKFALFNYTDGSKVLQSFNMSVSHNQVTSMVMAPSTSKPQASRMMRRDYPDYDDSTASTTTRQDYSLAQDEDGQVVISSGDGTDSLAIFNQTQNGWVNSTELFFGDKSEQEILDIIGTATATTTTASSTSTPTATETDSTALSDSSSGDSGNDNTGTIIGATLGGLVGLAIILILILMLLKRKKQKMARAGGLDKDRLSFQDQGVEPLTRSAYPMAESPAPRAASVDSLAIFTGNMGDEKSPRSAGALPQYMQKTQPARPSPLNNIQSNDNDYPGLDKEIEVEDSSARQAERAADEGWGKYFQNNSTPTLVGMSQYDSTRGSKATIWPGGANALPPLNMSFLDHPQPLGRVNSGSPTTEFATSIRDGRQVAIPQSQSAQISSADSISLHSDEDGDERGYNPRTQSWLGRPPSSAYSRSFYNPAHSTRELPSMAAQSPVDYRKHDSARTNTRGSSILIPEGQPLPLPRNNVNSDMSWLNLHADR
ncbi:hypothetical protein BJY01DRAFT_83982 [Aspergillus pseudoustus]|uniref:Pre-mRNA splicing factor CLF1 n=1 Tax=Aspergillus pseudoustus TaxID=1810923 RepID=A0ABR4J3B0_9EURO